MNSFTPKLETLPVEQQEIWAQLSPVVKQGFVLYGGTAIALQLGHRISVDFDFFRHEDLKKEAIFQDLPFCSHGQIIQNQPNALSLIYNKVQLSFFGDINFGRVEDPLISNNGNIVVANLDDLMATKVKVVLQRCAAKDYQDIAAMIQGGVSLEKGLASAQQMYGQTFVPTECLRALTYFEGGDLDILSKTEKDTICAAVAKIPNELCLVSLKNGLVDMDDVECNRGSGPRF
jgi:hypothetical protein